MAASIGEAIAQYAPSNPCFQEALPRLFHWAFSRGTPAVRMGSFA